MFVKRRQLDTFDLYGVCTYYDVKYIEITTLDSNNYRYSDILIAFDRCNKNIKINHILRSSKLNDVLGYFE